MLVIFSAAPDTASSGSNFNIQFPVEKLGGCNNTDFAKKRVPLKICEQDHRHLLIVCNNN